MAAEVHDEDQMRQAIMQLQTELDQIESSAPMQDDAASTMQVSL
jgi:hypothetical protein